MKARDSNGTSIPNGIGVVSPGQSITMECQHQDNILWSRRSVENPERIERLKDNERMIIKDNILTIHNIRFEDAMVYYCERMGINYRFFLNVYASEFVKFSFINISGK